MNGFSEEQYHSLCNLTWSQPYQAPPYQSFYWQGYFSRGFPSFQPPHLLRANYQPLHCVSVESYEPYLSHYQDSLQTSIRSLGEGHYSPPPLRRRYNYSSCPSGNPQPVGSSFEKASQGAITCSSELSLSRGFPERLPAGEKATFAPQNTAPWPNKVVANVVSHSASLDALGGADFGSDGGSANPDTGEPLIERGTGAPRGGAPTRAMAEPGGSFSVASFQKIVQEEKPPPRKASWHIGYHRKYA